MLPYLRPDGKTQVTVEYDADDRPVGVDTVVISSQHAKDISLDGMLAPDLRKHVLEVVLDEFGFDADNVRFLVNPTGKFEIGGPMGDAGLTGRKIIVDTYGGMARHGGGAFSGKDPSKVDRSAAYAMRWVAKNVVAAGLADRCEVQVAYAIGQGSSGRPVRRNVRHRNGPHRSDRGGGQRTPSTCARGDHRQPRPEAADLPADRRLRALRS